MTPATGTLTPGGRRHVLYGDATLCGAVANTEHVHHDVGRVSGQQVVDGRLPNLCARCRAMV